MEEVLDIIVFVGYLVFWLFGVLVIFVWFVLWFVSLIGLLSFYLVGVV